MLKLNHITVLILAGGLGTRLGDLTQKTPKPLLPIANKPFLDYVLAQVKHYGFTKVLLLTGFHGQLIKSYYRNSPSPLEELLFVQEKSPRGTGGAIKHAMEEHPNNFYLCLNGDSFFNINLNNFISKNRCPNEIARIAMFDKERDNDRYGSICIDKENRVLSFREKLSSNSNYSNGGIYYFSHDLLDLLTTSPLSLEKDIFPNMASNGQLYATPYPDAEFIDIGIPRDFNQAEAFFKKLRTNNEGTQSF